MLSEEEKFDAIIEPILYGDVFDFPLRLTEIHQFCSFEISLQELEEFVTTDETFGEVISRDKGLYFIKGRDELVSIRENRSSESDKCWQKARLVARVLRYIPFIDGIFVTGSLAVENAKKADDLDFLILTRPQRLWFVFGILGSLQRLISRRYLCPNYYIASDSLTLERRSKYVAREALQAQLLYGEDLYELFYEQNEWVRSYFPNIENNKTSEIRSDLVLKKGKLHFLRALLEAVLGGPIGEKCEKILRNLLESRLHIHYGLNNQKVPPRVLKNALEEKELRFHGLRHEEMIQEELEKRREQVRSLLAKRKSMI